MIPTLRSSVPLDKIYRIGAFSEESADILTAQMLKSASQQDEDETKHEHGDDHPPHTGDIEAITLTIPLLSEEKFQRLETWIQGVLWEGKGLDRSAGIESDGGDTEILRAKGMIYLKDGRRFVLQGVRDMYELKQLTNGLEGAKDGKIVLIGKGMPELETIQEALEGSLA
jgi:G3E family GTPase